MMQDPKGPLRVYELQGGFNEVLESLEGPDLCWFVQEVPGCLAGSDLVLEGLFQGFLNCH